jgi:thiol:disulfide interchange protein
VTYLIFSTVGLGMAAPYLVIGVFPGLIRFLPKPGAWMETVKQVMGFLLLGTVVYLFTTMNERYFIPTLTLLVGLWFACWLIGRTPLTAPLQTKLQAWGGGIGVAALIGLFAFHFLLHTPDIAWAEFSPEALSRARAEGKTVMVDFTADWCPNCKYNLAVAIDKPRVKDLVERNDVVPMLADWTDRSSTIKESLAALERQSIPVLAIWPANAADEGVIILDGLLTERQVLDALEQAGPSVSETAARTVMSTL